jgi:hypothetical protein
MRYLFGVKTILTCLVCAFTIFILGSCVSNEYPVDKKYDQQNNRTIVAIHNLTLNKRTSDLYLKMILDIGYECPANVDSCLPNNDDRMMLNFSATTERMRYKEKGKLRIYADSQTYEIEPTIRRGTPQNNYYLTELNYYFDWGDFVKVSNSNYIKLQIDEDEFVLAKEQINALRGLVKSAK